MERHREVSRAEQQVINREHQQWLALPITQALIRRIEEWAKPNPPQFMSTDSIAVYNANGIVQGAYQEIVDLMRAAPYPDADNDTIQQNIFDFNHDEDGI